MTMELDDLKNMWKNHEDNIEQNLKINTQLLKEVTLGRLKSSLLDFKLTNVMELVSYIIMSVCLINFLFHYIFIPRFSIPAVVLLILSGISIYWNIKGLEMLYVMKYTTPVLILQKKIEKIRIYEYWIGHLMIPITPIFTISLFVVGLKGFFGFDIYPYLNGLWSPYILISLVIGILIVWLIVRNNYKRWGPVNQFLNEIRKFEEEK